MAKGVNKAIIVGHLGQDPEVKYLQDGTAVANISVATTDSWKDKGSGEKREKTEWHRVSFFGRLAEVVGEYLTKGSLVYVEGQIQTRKWQDKEGNDRYTTEIRAREMNMLGGGREKRGGGSQRDENENQDARSNRGGGGGESAPTEDYDDDIPFITPFGLY